MKIGILTFHSSINPGSVLQAYCVYNLLKKSLPNSIVEIINLIPYNREINEWNFFSKKPPFIKVQSIIKYNSIRNFIKENTTLSKRVYYRSLSSQIRYINKQNYDYIFAGSDTIWMHSQKLDGLIPSIYFLPNEIQAKKVSIAASVDPLKNIEPYLSKKDVLKQIFEDFSVITVRDKFSEDLLLQMGMAKLKRIADPTFLFDFESELNVPINKQYKKERKKIMIWLTDKRLEKITYQALSKIVNAQLQPKNIYLSKNDDFLLRDLGRYAENDIIITDRFHRSIFGLKLSSALVINVEREEKNPFSISKGRDLFNTIGIPEYCIRYEKESEKEYTENLLRLTANFTEAEFLKRESYLESYILDNKNKWENLVLSVFNTKNE